MNPYKVFLLYPNSDNYDWEIFADEFSAFILNDIHLKNLLSKYDFLKDNWEEICFELKEEVKEELIYLGYYDKNEFNEDKFYKSITSIAENTLIALITRYFILDFEISTDRYVDHNSFLEFDLPNLNQVDKEFQKEISDVIIDFKNFSLDKNQLLIETKSWNSSPIIKHSRVEKNPEVKLIDHFDPLIFKMIQENPELLNTIDWRTFEELLAEILKSFNYQIQLTKMTRDGGIDIIALKRDSNFGFHKYILQAKRYKTAIQVRPVRELLFLHNDLHITKSCLATTSAFTKGAWQLADKYRWVLELKDRQGIIEWIDRAVDLNKK